MPLSISFHIIGNIRIVSILESILFNTSFAKNKLSLAIYSQIDIYSKLASLENSTLNIYIFLRKYFFSS
ncbi:MAG: hypothetical protein Q8S84_06150 [bacterium]|nr:hypothetical protein [bacterium]MDP3381056.1 hypothetical protein [bacterium]